MNALLYDSPHLLITYIDNKNEAKSNYARTSFRFDFNLGKGFAKMKKFSYI